MAVENPVHFKIGYEDSLDAKKNILYSQVSLLNLVKIVKRYKAWRAGELEIKSQLFKSMGEMDLSIKKAKSYLPYLKMPEEEKAPAEPQPKKGKKETAAVKNDSDADDELNSQLQNIQDRLNSLSQ
jgi:hypothetical protein